MFSAVRRECPAQVSTLLRRVSATVVDVDPGDASVSLDSEYLWLPDASFVHSSGVLTPLVVTPDRLWLEDVSSFAVGDRITQSKHEADLLTLFAAFEEQWSRLWAKHTDVSPTQWDDVFAFNAKVLPPRTCDPVVHSVDSLRWSARRKKPKAAVGLDGVSRSDLLTLSDPELSCLVSLFDSVERHGAWPQQLLNARVNSLSKCDDPTDVTHFRPITIMGFIYRMWSSVSSQHWISQFGHVLDPLLCGNRSGFRAASAWHHVMAKIEAHRSQDRPATGLVLDLVKAFNQVPRLPALHACKLLGMHQRTLVAWSGMLGCVKRHFLIDGSCSPGVFSNCGMPEGCGLSCAGMLALTEVFHRWMKALQLPLYAVSYVDDWQVFLSQPEQVEIAMRQVDRFIDAWDMQRDHAKTYVWSTDACVRSQLRAEGKTVHLSARALGAHVTYTRQITNGTLLARIRGLDTFWDSLQRFPGTFKQKIQLITRVAWPRGLHACSSVVLGRKHLQSLRTEVARAVRCDKPGISPYLLCFLEHHLCDPQLYVLFDSIRDFRALDPVNGMLLLGESASGEVKLEWNSIHEILLQRLHQLGFQILPNGCVLDALGPCDFSTCSFAEIRVRVMRQWHEFLSSQLRSRLSFCDFSLVDPCATRLDFVSQTSFHQGVLRRWLTGASLANNIAWRWSADGNTACTQCGLLDSPDHRLWHCSASSALRDTFDPAILATLKASPDVCRLHGWTLASPSEPHWLSYLANLPVEFCFHEVVLPPGRIDLFTDGSCHCQAHPRCRVASFSVVYSPGIRARPSVADLIPVCAQPLGGILQIAYRAELMAVLAAGTFAVDRQRPVTIWSDCAGVVARFWAHFGRGVPIRMSQAHSDLWFQLQTVLADFPVDFVQVRKVPAHVEQHPDETAVDEWLRQGNSSADASAKAANVCRPQWVWDLWAQMVDEQWTNDHLGSEMRRLILGTTAIWSEGGDAKPAAALVVQPTRITREFQMRWCADSGFELCKPTFRRLFGDQFAEVVRTWLTSVLDDSAAVRWISYVQLYISFQLAKGPVSVLNKGRKWTVVQGVQPRLQNHLPFMTKVKAFRLILQQFLKDTDVSYATATLRPVSEMVVCHRGSVSLPLSMDVQVAVDSWLSSRLSTPANGQGKALASLPDPWSAWWNVSVLRSLSRARTDPSPKKHSHFIIFLYYWSRYAAPLLWIGIRMVFPGFFGEWHPIISWPIYVG